jgi:hypothetical protein
MASLDRQLETAERMAGFARELCRFVPRFAPRRRSRPDEAQPDPNAPVAV